MKIPFFVLLLLLTVQSRGQTVFRIKSDFTIKEKKADGKQLLIMGVVYYDINFKKVVYNVTFPEKEAWVFKDDKLYSIKNNKISEHSSFNLSEYTIFHLCLTEKLFNYGMENSGYIVKKIEQDKGKIITTWSPPPSSKLTGDIKLMQEDKKLIGVVSLDKKDNVISKQLFKNYVLLSGITFPLEIIQIYYTDKSQENYKVINFKNPVVNELSNETLYNYPIN